MNTELSIAIEKHFAKINKAAKPLSPGEYSVKKILTLEISGSIKKCEDEQYIPTAEIPVLEALALCIKKAGIQRKNIMDMLISSMKEAIENKIPIDILEDIEEAKEKVKESLSKLPPKNRSGKTLVNVDVVVK